MSKLEGQRKYFQFHVVKEGEIKCRENHNSNWVTKKIAPTTKSLERGEDYYKKTYEYSGDSSNSSEDQNSSDFESYSEENSSEHSEGPPESPATLEPRKSTGSAKNSETSQILASKKVINERGYSLRNRKSSKKARNGS